MSNEFEHLEEFRVLREKWTHEDQVVNHRLTWLLLSQAMLLGAYGWALNSHEPRIMKLLVLLPVLGVAFTASIGASIVASIAAQDQLKHFAGSASWPDPFKISAHQPVNWAGRTASIVLPFFFLLVWLVLIIG